MIFNPSPSVAGGGSSDKSDLVKGTYPVATGDSISAGDLVDVNNGYVAKKSALSELSEGDIIQLNENGSPVDFYIAKFDYESDLNGTGRVLIVRKDCYDSRPFGGTYYFDTSDICAWLNGDYKALLDEEVQTAIATTTIDVTTTQKEYSIFLLSLTEYGGTGEYVEGSKLPAADIIRPAYGSGEVVAYWTRTTYAASSLNRWCVDTLGQYSNTYNGNSAWSRPAFTLPDTFTVNTPVYNKKAIALTSGTAGQDVEVIFCGTTAADFATEGEYFNWDGEGVKAYAPMDGVLTVFPWYEPQPDIPVAEFGSYVGQSATPNNTYTVSVDLGYRPKAVFVSNRRSAWYYDPGSNPGVYAAMALDGYPATFPRNDSGTVLEITDSGFTAYSYKGSSTTVCSYLANGTNYFIAWR